MEAGQSDVNLDTHKQLVGALIFDEGYRKSAYQDSLGFWTIGYGRLIDAGKNAGLSKAEAAYLLDNDVYETIRDLTPYEWYVGQDDVRQAALANMAFNLGVEALAKEWPHFTAAMLARDYPLAASILTGSLWRKQVGPRADRIIHMIETGTWP